jgi:3D (Asp-Asp-Asp) domain-containing protein
MKLKIGLSNFYNQSKSKALTYNFRLKHILFVTLVLVLGCNKDKNSKEVSLKVTATAYNSLENQTLGNPNLTAWGDTLKPGDKAIAVSRDLIQLGLSHNQEVKIEGWPGTFIVKDKMNKRWSNKIDIYMGEDFESARKWGRQEVEITFEIDAEFYEELKEKSIF